MRKLRYLLLTPFISVINLLTGETAFCQDKVRIHGTVFDVSKTRPLEGVSVLSTKDSTKGTSTDARGNYSIYVDRNDSIYFSYQGKATVKYAVQTIVATNNFDIWIPVRSTLLPEVTVRQRSYKEDSLQNRQDYAKIFNYNKPRFKITPSSGELGGLGAGVDLDGLIDIFRIRKKRDMQAFQNRLIDNEEDKYIDHRFNRAKVKELTGLEGEKLERFMKRYRPPYFFVKGANEYELYEYIKTNGKKFEEVLLQEEKDKIKTP